MLWSRHGAELVVRNKAKAGVSLSRLVDPVPQSRQQLKSRSAAAASEKGGRATARQLYALFTWEWNLRPKGVSITEPIVA